MRAPRLHRSLSVVMASGLLLNAVTSVTAVTANGAEPQAAPRSATPAASHGMKSADAGTDPLTLLPALPRLRPATSSAFPLRGVTLTELGNGVSFAHDLVVLRGTTQFDQGPRDGLEVLACLREGKTHEAFIRLEIAQGEIVKAACIAAFNVNDGQVTSEASGIPARGTPLRVRVHWQDSDDSLWRSIDASALVRDRLMDRAYPPLPYMYTGSHERVIPSDAGAPERRMLMLNNSRSVIGNFDEADLLLASPFPGARIDDRFEVAGNVAPRVNTPVLVTLEPCALPLTLQLDGTALRRSATSAVLDDTALGALLAQHYSVNASPAFRAVHILVPAASPREDDVAARTRLLAVAAQAKAWVVPVFSARTP